MQQKIITALIALNLDKALKSVVEQEVCIQGVTEILTGHAADKATTAQELTDMVMYKGLARPEDEVTDHAKVVFESICSQCDASVSILGDWSSKFLLTW